MLRITNYYALKEPRLEKWYLQQPDVLKQSLVRKSDGRAAAADNKVWPNLSTALCPATTR